MKFDIEKQAALDVIAAIHSIVLKKTTIPILTTFHIVANDAGAIAITSTDLDMTATFTLTDKVRVSRPGMVCASADKLSDIAKAIPDGAELAFELDGPDSRLKVSAGRSRFTMPVLPPEDFPVIRETQEPKASFGIAAGVLARMLDVGSFCAGVDDARDYLNCGFLHTTDGKLRIVATEGHRLAYCDTAAPAGVEIPEGVMLPPKVITTLRRLLANVAPDELVDIAVTPTKVIAQIGSTHINAKLLDASATTYPAYKRMIPPPELVIGTIVADTDLFMAALRRVIIMAEPKNGYTVNVDVEDGRMSFAARNVLEGQAGEEIEAEWSGPPTGFAVNGPWLFGLLERIRTENVIMQLFGKDRGMPVYETGESDWFGMVAPMER